MLKNSRSPWRKERRERERRAHKELVHDPQTAQPGLSKRLRVYEDEKRATHTAWQLATGATAFKVLFCEQ